ncbi:MAG: hypothetical protein IKS55_04250 [Oscillospiraceae bacterium]|nr:hypothetical protein [Oscillospiraceae bacterium]
MNKKQSTLSIAIGVACVWMGTHFGPGVASGTQILVYWVKYGIWGAVASVLAMALLGYCIYCSAEFSRIYKTYNYADWTKEVWGVKWIVYLLDFSFIIVMMTALGGSLNAIGTLMYNQFGLNYWIGVILVIICAALLCAYGAKLVSRASSYMMYLVLAVLAVIIIMALSSGQLHLGEALANINAGRTNGIKPSFLGALWSGIIYASFQANVIGNISSVSEQLPNRSTARKAAVIGVCGNSLMLVALTLFFLASTTIQGYDVMDTASNPLPFYGVLHALGFSGVKLIYVITVFVAVLSTAVGFCFGAIARYSKLYRKPDEKTPLKDAILVAVLLLLCALASKLGIVKLVSTGYTILGYLNLPLLIFPAIVLANRKIRKPYLTAHNMDMSGVDE